MLTTICGHHRFQLLAKGSERFGEAESVERKTETRYRSMAPLVPLVLACVIAGTFATTAAASFARFGDYFLEYGHCCSNEPLNGTSSDIIVNYAGPDSAYCVVFRSDAEFTNQYYLIQDGAVKCGSSSGGLDFSCSKNINLVYFVETETPSVGYTCYPHGSVGTGSGFIAEVVNSSGTTWTPWLNFGSFPSETIDPGASTALYLFESAEHTHTDVCTGWTASGTWESGPTEDYRWLRYNRSSGVWSEVQSAQEETGCWSISGAPPNTFTISH